MKPGAAPGGGDGGGAGTGFLVGATVAGFVLEALDPARAVSRFALWPPGSGFMPWQLLSYAFLHANLLHLAFNLVGLWSFGRPLEMVMGWRAIVQMYTASVLAAAAVQVAVASGSGSPYPTLGASGGVFGLLLGFAICFPKQTVMLLFPPIPMPAWLFAVLYAGIELALGLTGTLARVAHFAHLGGMAGALLFLWRWRQAPREVP